MQRMYAFSESAGGWVPWAPMTNGPLKLETLRVATYNVWFDPYESERRRTAVFDILDHESADVIALEEVTGPFLEALLACDWVRRDYLISRTRLDPPVRYDVVMLSRLPVRRFVAHVLTSAMGRRLHTLELDTTEGLLAVAGIHLESMREMTPTRLTQIEECMPLLEQAHSAVWLGDFNAAPASPEDTRIRATFRDAWEAVDGQSPGYTRDTTNNAMLARIKDDRHQRIDRIFIKSQKLEATSIRMLGTAPIEGTLGLVFPSDHFGLIADLSFRT